jgi:antitoxin component YwqK of YwqJK toxin-antitoxin module
MAKQKSKAKEHIHYHKDGSIWGKGQMQGGVMTGYWEWFRKDGSKMRSGFFENGQQAGEWTTYDQHGKAVKVTLMTSKAKAAKAKSSRTKVK